ncbi:MAG TPA: outer membrane lipoprotein-sorting protein [Chthoniobacterales bacterium]
MPHRLITAIFLGLFLLTCSLLAAESDRPAAPAAELAAHLAAKQQGTAYIRVRMDIPGGTANVLQLQIKSRVSRGNADLVYQVLFPKERKGEAVLLRRSGNRISGTLHTPNGAVRELGAANFDEPLFGSALSYEDVIDDFFGWSQQAIVGTDEIDHIACQILESKPGKGRRSSYSSVRTWVDPNRLIPLRIEKYNDKGQLLRQIVVTRITLDGGDSIPVNLSVRDSRGLATEIDGSRIKRGVAFTDAEFTPEGLKQITPPRGAPE